MSSPRGAPSARRPLPALVFLLALTLLAALVWWRVLDHADGHAVAEATCTPAPSTPAPPKQLPEQAAVTVQVLNSTNRQGIAGKAQQVLGRDGFRTPAAADNDNKTYPGYAGEVKGVATIRYGTAAAGGAHLLSYYFPGATLTQTSATDSTVLVSLGEKYKAVASAKQVTTALAAAGIKLVPVSGAVPQQSASGCVPASGTPTSTPSS